MANIGFLKVHSANKDQVAGSYVENCGFIQILLKLIDISYS